MTDLTHEMLWRRYQQFFSKSKPGGMRYPIEFGIEVGAGWLPLLDNVLRRISDEVSGMPLEVRRSFGISQIKEKFSELRIYYTPRSKGISELISEAALFASRTCTECGNFGALYRVGSYLSIKCRDCVTMLAVERGAPAVRIPTGELN